jgi:Na+/H+-dicarboxylate symporter
MYMPENKKTLPKISMTVWILVSTVGGVVFGSLAGPWAANVKFIGDIFLRLIQMTVVVMVMTAVIGAVGGLQGKGLGRMGFHTFKWFLLFTVFAASLGLMIGRLVQPGAGVELINPLTVTAAPEQKSVQDTILGFFGTNIISSMAAGTMIPCIVFSIIFGLAISKHRAATGSTLTFDWIKDLNKVVMRIIQMVMQLAPLGVFCLLANVAGAIGFKVVIPMVKYLLCLAIGDAIMLIIYCVFAGARCGVNIAKMPGKFAKMSLIALTTTSSAITLPTKMEDSVKKFGVSRKVSDFVGPLAMSMNSSGAALCNVVVINFLAQISGTQLTSYQLVMGILLSCMLCMGTITVPGGFVVTATFLAVSLGLPPEAIALMLGVDWFAGMFRTLLNVDADVIVALLVANSEGELDRDVYNGMKEVEYV